MRTSLTAPSRRPTTLGRQKMLVALGAAITLVAGLLVGLAAPANAAPAPAKTIVSLTFDDGIADQLTAADIMKAYGMAGTFYLTSGFIGATGFLTLDQVRSLAAAGNEIAGHTVSHPDLTTVSVDEATRQICNDRVNWNNWAIPVQNFAYPFAASTPAVEAAVKNCGYNSGRGLGDIKTRFSCPACAVAETMPPADAYFTKTPDQVETTWTLDDLKQAVTQTEATGGWVQLTFHHICDPTSSTTCVDPAVSPAIFQQFVAWLAPRATSKHTQVKTVGTVIGGTTAPVVQGPVVPPAGPGVNGAQNASMETIDAATGLPQCFIAGGYGSNTPTWQVTADSHTGASAVQMTMATYVDGESILSTGLDLGQCAPTVTVGKTYTLGEWYKSTANTQFDVYYRTALGTWTYWTSSPWFAASAPYAQATWVTPPVPVGATALSFGLNLFSDGSLTTDDLSMVETTAVTPAAMRTTTTAALSSTQPASPFAITATALSGAAAGRAVTGKIVTHHVLIPHHSAGGAVPGRAASAKAPNVAHPDSTTFVVSPELTLG